VGIVDCEIQIVIKWKETSDEDKNGFEIKAEISDNTNKTFALKTPFRSTVAE